MRELSRAVPACRSVGLAGLAALVALLAGAGPLHAQPVRIDERRDLEFGLIAAGQTTGPVRVTPLGAAICAPHTCLGGQAGGLFRVSGKKNGVYSVNYSTGDTLNRVGGGGSMPVGNFTDDAAGTLVLNPGGQGRLRFGGDLTVGPTTPGGAYTGTFTVIFNLQ